MPKKTTLLDEEPMIAPAQDSDIVDAEIVNEPAEPQPSNQLAVQATNPMSMIQFAIEHDKGIETLEKLFELQQRDEAAKARNAYNAAMSAAQAEMPAVVRDKENTHLRTKYARLETVASAIRPVYTKHGFSLSFGTLTDASPDCIKIFCDCRHSAGHVDRIEGNFPIDLKGTGGSVNKTGIQAMGSTISYARRYLTLMIFNVSIEDEDNDGNGQPVDCIDRGQVARLERELNLIPPDENALERILKWANIETLADLPKDRFELALQGLVNEARKFNS
jgi:hypothetical protein